MSEHVPGPWLIDPDDRRDMEWNNHIVDQHGNAICFMAHSGGKHPDQDQANAYLIAAAPDLLEALKEMVAYSEVPPPQKAINAIKKAEGREASHG